MDSLMWKYASMIAAGATSLAFIAVAVWAACWTLNSIKEAFWKVFWVQCSWYYWVSVYVWWRRKNWKDAHYALRRAIEHDTGKRFVMVNAQQPAAGEE